MVDCCTAAECVAKAKLACVRGLSCSHPCGGIAGEALCPPCLHIDCAREGTSFPTLPRVSLLPLTLACAARVCVCAVYVGMQTGSDLCLICYVEELRAAPCVQLSCGHFFHFECAKSKVSNGWSGKHAPLATQHAPRN